jgi:methionine-S-sulfoxide reductase
MRVTPLLSCLVVLASSSSACQAAPSTSEDKAPAPVPAAKAGQEVAVLAGGCFWCLEADLDKLPGVIATTSGYAGGKKERPTYDEVGTALTGHTEVVHVVFDPKKVAYGQLLDYFWRHIDPTDAGGQFCDRGPQYRPAVFPQTPEQLAEATASRDRLSASGALARPVAVEITPGQTFWSAEVYHQDFYKKNPAHYQRYRSGCGRDAKVAEVWKAPTP